MTVTEFLDHHDAYLDEDRCLHLYCTCDGTLLFMNEMIEFLTQIGATDIEHYTEYLDKSPDSERPWLTCRFCASGILPA